MQFSARTDLHSVAPGPNQRPSITPRPWGAHREADSDCAEKVIKLACDTSAHLLNEADGQPACLVG